MGKSMGKYSILLVEDSIDIVEKVSHYLTKAGYRISVVSNSSQALQTIKEQNFDLIILDVLLPDSTGYDLCVQLRKYTYCPIIFISRLSSEDNITKALAMGGDDYITKPFRPKEIVARIKAILRRTKYYSKLQENGNALQIGNLILNNEQNKLSSPKISINLTPLEFSIFTYLLQHEGQMVSYKRLFEAIWESEVIDDYRTVMVHVSNLKIKLKKLNANQQFITNIRGQGYVLKL